MNAASLPSDPTALQALVLALQEQIAAKDATIAGQEATLVDQQVAIADQEAALADQQAAITEYKATVAELTGSVDELTVSVEQLTEQVRLLKAMYFAKRSEQQAVPTRQETQYSLFDEAEFVAETPDAEAPGVETMAVAAHVRAKRGRRPIPAEYPREEVVHDIPEDEKTCGCGCELIRIGEVVSEKLDIIPQRVRVIRHIRPKYACRGCEGTEDDGPTVKVAPMPPQLIEQGIVTSGLLAYILVSKFCDGLPFYRQSRMFDRLGVDIARATMSNWALLAARACEPLLDRFHAALRAGDIINMDETPLQVLKEPGRKNTTKSYMWITRGGAEQRPVVLFRYAPSRAGEVAEALVGNFTGFLQTDGYKGYTALGERKGIVHVGCLAHVRRKFVDVLKAGSKKKKGVASTVVDLIGKLYHLESQARKQELDAHAVFAMRQEKVAPILDKIKAHMQAAALTTPPKSLLGKAVAYGLGQWPRIEAYLQDGRLSPDNNVAENAIRPFAVGRKNWLFSGSPRGAHASAALYSLIETAKANKLNPYDYLLHVFDALPKAACEEDLDALMPWAMSKNEAVEESKSEG